MARTADADTIAAPTLPDLLPMVANGDHDAAQACVERYGGLVWSMARRAIPNPADAEDAAQEVFVKLWRNAQRFDAAVASERTFVTMLAKRCLIDHQRKRARTPQSESLDESTPAETTPPADRMIVAEQTARVIELLRHLSEERRRILELKMRSDWSYQRIAQFFGLPLGTVKSQARRGMMRIRELLAEGEPRLAQSEG